MPSDKGKRREQQCARRTASRLPCDEGVSVLSSSTRQITKKTGQKNRDPKWLSDLVKQHELHDTVPERASPGTATGIATPTTTRLTIPSAEYSQMSYRHRRAIDFSAIVQIGRKQAPMTGKMLPLETKQDSTRVRTKHMYRYKPPLFAILISCIALCSPDGHRCAC